MKANILAMCGLLLWMAIISIIVIDLIADMEEIREATVFYEQHMLNLARIKNATEGYYEVEFN